MFAIEEELQRLSAKKHQLEMHEPFPKGALDNLEEWLKVELTYSSNAIEGNTLTRLETAEVIEKGMSAVLPAKPLKDQLEAINHSKALTFIQSLSQKRRSHQDITEEDILSIHRLILTGINDEWAGRYRQSEVFVKGASVVFPLPQNVPYAMDEFIQWLERTQGEHPVRVAADAHFKLVTIHPFVDGNGRTARLLMNLILVIHHYPMAVIRNEDRTAYLEAVNKGQTKGDLTAFYQIVVNAVERSVDTYLAAVEGKAALSIFENNKSPAPQRLLKIGELAQATGETIHTLRYWTKLGLLSTAAFSPGGYQLYAPSMVARVRTIRQLQSAKRLTLHEIQQQIEKAA